MNKRQRILFGVYGVLVFIFGVLKVPAYAIWGPERNVETLEFIPIWKLTQHNRKINGFTPIYELDYWRAIFFIGVLTLLTCVLYLIFSNGKKMK